jgi:hypothetical protein
MPVPETGQIVRLENVEDQLIVKKVIEDEQTVDLVSTNGDAHTLESVPVSDLLPGEDLSAG